ncbi:MAG: glycoside hydrolase family 9 protein [Bacillota bacterium]
MKRLHEMVAVVMLGVILLSGCTTDRSASSPPAAEPEPQVRVGITVNQVGYLPGAPKVATLYLPDESDTAPTRFRVVRADDGTEVLKGLLKGPLTEPEAGGRKAWLADFSALKTEGTYKVRAGSSESPPFRIAANVFDDLFAKVTRSYYLQRSGFLLDDPVTGLKHEACHLAKASLFEDKSVSLDVSGGWHDAGDYGKYIPPAAVTIGQLLLLYEVLPQAAEVKLQGTDLLSEVRYELDWMLKMQRSDGAVYHKVTTENFPGMIMPEADTAPLIIYPVGTASTGLFAGAMARAARAFAPSDPAYAKRLGDAAKQAWRWLEKNRNLINPPVGNTGPYLSNSDHHAREWAAAELFALTGEPSYERYLLDNPRTTVGSINWERASGLALFTYVATPKADPAYRAKVEEVILAEAKRWVERAKEHPYGVALGVSEYVWASAKATQAIGLHLIMANRLRPDPAFLEVAAAQLDWVLGRNPLERSFVTGVGANPPKNPHHRLVIATGKMVPGLLVGGPNDRGQDRAVPKGLGARSYVDDNRSYSSNEPAIDYNAPLVFVAGWFALGHDFR